MNHFAIHLRLMQHCKSTILQFKKKRVNCGLDIQVGVTSPGAVTAYFNK